MPTNTIAIIGGGPAGSTAAEKLADGWGLAGPVGVANRILVFEEKAGWEKPCGGGLTHKALRRYPYLADAQNGGKLLTDAELIASSGETLRLQLGVPLAIYSRATLNSLLLKRAEQAGAEVVADRIVGVRREADAWEIQGRDKTYRADFVVLAGGARSRLRKTFAGDFKPSDFMLTFGYYLPLDREPLRVQFYDQYEGYAWSFPRPDHVSVGIGGNPQEGPMASLKARLDVFMKKFGYSPDPERIFSHVLPALSLESWANLVLAGKGWALAGDAAGLVDPLTGEGIYYAMRSGELLAQSLLEGVPEAYPERVQKDFARALAFGARLVRKFYRGEIRGQSVPTRMIEFGAASDIIRQVMEDLIAGSQSYAGLMARLQAGLAQTLVKKGVGRLREALRAALSSSNEVPLA